MFTKHSFFHGAVKTESTSSIHQSVITQRIELNIKKISAQFILLCWIDYARILKYICSYVQPIKIEKI